MRPNLHNSGGAGNKRPYEDGPGANQSDGGRGVCFDWQKGHCQVALTLTLNLGLPLILALSLTLTLPLPARPGLPL